MNKNLQIRKNACQLIENIRTVRNVIRTGKFNADMFEQINGLDNALEGLVEHEVVFACLDDSGRTQLRREIMNKLTENEISAFGKLRAALEAYFQPIDQMVAGYSFYTDDAKKIVDKVKTIKPEIAAVMENGSVDSGCFTQRGVQHVVSAFDAVSNFITAVTPILERVYASSEEIAVGDGSTAAPPEQIEEDPPMEDPDHEVLVDPNEENDEMMTEVATVADDNRSMQACADHFVREGGTMSILGYTSVESVTTTLASIEGALDRYVKSVKAYRDMYPVATCPSDNLVKGNETFIKAVVAVADLIGKCEEVRSHLNETRDTLVDVLGTLERGF